MMIRPLVLSAIGLCGLLSFAQSAHASAADPRIKLLPESQERVAIPDEFQREWVLSNCESGARIMRFSRYFHMNSVMSDSRITRTDGITPMGRNIYKLSMPRDTSMITLKKSGDLLQYYPQPGDFPTVAAVESGRALATFLKFKNCDGQKKNNFVVENKEMIALLPRLDRMHEACPKRADLMKESCQAAILNLFDRNGDEIIDLDEMKASWEILGRYNGSGSCAAPAIPGATIAQGTAAAAPTTDTSLPNTPAPTATAITVALPAAAPTMTVPDGAPYFEWLIGNLDRNGDHALSYDEVRGQWDRMTEDSLMAAFIQTLKTAEEKLRYLPPPEGSPQ